MLLTAASPLRPPVNYSSVESLQLKRQKAKFYHDKHVRQLLELEIGQEVTVAPLRFVRIKHGRKEPALRSFQTGHT